MPLNAKLDADPATPEEWTPIKLDYSKEEMEAFARFIAVRIETSNESRRGSGFEDMVRARRDEYECQRLARPGPWPGSVNLRLPTSFSIVNTISAHLYKTLAVQPFFMGIPSYDAAIPQEEIPVPQPPPGFPPELQQEMQQEAQSIEQQITDEIIASANRKQQALDYYLRYPMRFQDTIRETLPASMIDGGHVWEIGWSRKIEKKRRFDVVTPELRQEILEKYSESAPELAGQLDAYEDGQWVVIKDYVVTLDQPFCEGVDILDFNCYPPDPKAGPPTDRFRHVLSAWRRVWLSSGDLMAGVATGEFDRKAVEAVLETTNPSPEVHSLNAGGDQPRHQTAGFNQNIEVENDDKPYESFRGVIRYDCDGDGFVELVLFHIYVAGGTPILLRAEEFPYFHDHFPFTVNCVHERPGFLFPYSLVELLKPLAIEVNATRNQAVDCGTLRNMPTFLRSNTSKWNPEKTPFTPGTVISVNNVDTDIKLLEMPPADASLLATEDRARADMKELAGINDTMINPGPSGDKTATELERSLQSVNVKFDVLLDACRVWLDEAAFQVSSLLAQYSKPNTRIFNGFQKGRAVFADITREDMQTRLGFQARGTSALANPVLKAQKAEKLHLWGMQSEFVQYDPAHRYALAKRFVESFDDEGDTESIIGTLDAFNQFVSSQEPPDPVEKINLSGRMDEISTLALAVKNGWLDEKDMEIAANITKLIKMIVPAPPEDAGVTDAPDNPPGYQKGGPA